MTNTQHSPSHPCRLDQVSRWDGEADVLIVGFGIAGACAALEATAAGAHSIIFEVAAGYGEKLPPTPDSVALSNFLNGPEGSQAQIEAMGVDGVVKSVTLPRKRSHWAQ